MGVTIVKRQNQNNKRGGGSYNYYRNAPISQQIIRPNGLLREH